MALPLIPIVAGAAIGALATYLYKDESARASLKKGFDSAGDTLSKGAGTVKGAVKRKMKGGEAPKAVKRKAATRKKATAKKRVVKKKGAEKAAEPIDAVAKSGEG